MVWSGHLKASFQLDTSRPDFSHPRLQSRLTDPVTPLTSLYPESFQSANLSFITRSPGLDALTNPRLFFGQLLVKRSLSSSASSAAALRS